MNKELTADHLNKIVSFLHDSRTCYADHINHVGSPHLKQLFNSLNLSRERMIHELRELLIGCGIEASNNGTALGQAHRLYENMKVNLTNGDPLIIAKEIRRGEGILIQYYQEAIKQDLPESLKDKLLAHMEEIGENLKAVDKLTVES